MNLILWLVMGALAGYLARLILGYASGRWWLDIILGVLGAMAGGSIATALGLGAITGFNLYSLLVAIAGACLLLVLIRLLRRHLN